MYFVLSLIIIVPFGFIALITSAARGREGIAGALFGGVFIFLMPIVYAVLGFIFVAIGCLFYNLVAKYVGGIEIEIE
jgi:hypothetical protein